MPFSGIKKTMDTCGDIEVEIILVAAPFERRNSQRLKLTAVALIQTDTNSLRLTTVVLI